MLLVGSMNSGHAMDKRDSKVLLAGPMNSGIAKKWTGEIERCCWWALYVMLMHNSCCVPGTTAVHSSETPDEHGTLNLS